MFETHGIGQISDEEVLFSPVSVRLFVCFFVRGQDYAESSQAIFLKRCWITDYGKKSLNFDLDPTLKMAENMCADPIILPPTSIPIYARL